MEGSGLLSVNAGQQAQRHVGVHARAADALHAQREHAEFLVTQKKAHYNLAVKNNQPPLSGVPSPGPSSRP